MYGREYEGIFRISYLIDENGMIEKGLRKSKAERACSRSIRGLELN